SAQLIEAVRRLQTEQKLPQLVAHRGGHALRVTIEIYSALSPLWRNRQASSSLLVCTVKPYKSRREIWYHCGPQIWKNRVSMNHCRIVSTTLACLFTAAAAFAQPDASCTLLTQANADASAGTPNINHDGTPIPGTPAPDISRGFSGIPRSAQPRLTPSQLRILECTH